MVTAFRGLSYIDASTVTEKAGPLTGYSKFVTAKICSIRFLLCAFALSNIHLKDLTCAHKTIRVRVPPSICSTHCPHPPSWDKPWVTPVEYLSPL